ncbi:MAG: hypothetical protein SNJ66_09955, partial [Chloroherpetonaceae bacterium]
SLSLENQRLNFNSLLSAASDPARLLRLLRLSMRSKFTTGSQTLSVIAKPTKSSQAIHLKDGYKVYGFCRYACNDIRRLAVNDSTIFLSF